MKQTSDRTKIVVAIIGAIAMVVAAIIGAQFFSDWVSGSESSEAKIAIRVSDSLGSSVSGAKVLIFYEGGSFGGYTDTNGTTILNVAISQDTNARLVVETDQYEIYESEIQLPYDKKVNVRLKERPADESSFIFRVVDDNDNTPVSGAEILILIEGDIYNQTTDSNGIAKLTIPVFGNKLEAQISINTENYEIKYQEITLLPNKVQDIRLNPKAGSITSSSPTYTTTSPSLPTDVPADTPPPLMTELSSAYQIEIRDGSTQSGQGALIVQLLRGDRTPITGKQVSVYKQKQDLAGNWVVDGRSIKNGYTDSTGAITFDLDPGYYILSSNFTGYNWGDAYDVQGKANIRIEMGKITNVRIALAQLVVGFLRGDGTPIVGQPVRIYTQKKDLAGNWVTDGGILTQDYTDNTGTVTFNLVPGHYIISSNFDGYNWGTAYDVMGVADFALPAGQVTELIQRLGRLTVGLMDSSGNPLQGELVSVYLQVKDINNNIMAGDRASYNYTDNTGTVNFDLTPGFYAVRINDNYTYDVPVEAGRITFGKGGRFEVQP
ncbi:MAG: hypothetical protein D6732_27825 [Methanobacteriota archaeon]|nr:MAG: hypothetical protein D6732_27825 [Euryarchaeota archaeon]